MAREMTVAPRERINIVYESSTAGLQEEVELPLKLLVIGDFTQQLDESRLEDRRVISITKTNIDDVMEASKLHLSFNINNTLLESLNGIPIELNIEKIKDFSPENIIKQVPELSKLMRLREALTMLKGPMGNVPTFRKTLQSMVNDEDVRKSLLLELKENQDNQNQDAD